MSRHDIDFIHKILAVSPDTLENLTTILKITQEFFGLSAIAVQNQQNEIISQVNTVSSSAIALPLTHGELLIGRVTPLTSDEHRILDCVITQVNTLIQHLRLQKELENERYQYELANTLRDISGILTSELELKVVLDNILEQVARVLPYDAASIWMLNAEDGYLSALTWRGYDKFGMADVVANTRYDFHQSKLLAHILETQDILIIADVKAEPEWKLKDSYPWIASWASSPIVVNGRIIGQFNLDHTQKNFYGTQHRPIIEAFTQQVNIAVTNAYLYAELRQNKQELQTLLEREQDLGALKSRFISMVSHEFRTPLASILTNVSLLSDYQDRITRTKKALLFDNIKHQIRYLDQLVEEVLLVNKGDSIGFELNIDRDDFAEFCNRMLSEMRAICSSSIQFVMVLDPECHHMAYDSKLMQHLLLNLLSNAAKYSPDGGTVMLSIKEHENGIRLTVSDEGIGIPLVDQKRLFDHFFRASNVGSISGTGVGLTIIKKVVEAYEGNIAFDSTPDVGTTFTVELPLYDLSAASLPDTNTSAQ